MDGSNFWQARIRKDNNTTDDASRIPFDPSLDKEGMLPSGAYQLLGDAENEPKPTCRLTIALNEATSSYDITHFHRFMDCGLTTFSLDNNNLELHRKLKQDTPRTVLEKCQFVVPLKTPSISIMAEPSIVRDVVLQSLKRTGAECIDTLQLERTYLL